MHHFNILCQKKVSFNKFPLISSSSFRLSSPRKYSQHHAYIQRKQRKRWRIKCNSLRQFSVITDSSSHSHSHNKISHILESAQRSEREEKEWTQKKQALWPPKKKEIKKMETRNCNKKDEWVWGQNILYVVWCFMYLCACVVTGTKK